MFGRTHEAIDNKFGGSDIDDFFGDEQAADHGTQIEHLGLRVKQVEGQIHSQFTSMAAYAQIAQEQIELARAESRAETVRTEGRLIQLIERERADRMACDRDVSGPVGTPGASDLRLTALEDAVATIKIGISDCLSRQKALADAITALFEPQTKPDSNSHLQLPPPADSPIGGLALRD